MWIKNVGAINIAEATLPISFDTFKYIVRPSLLVWWNEMDRFEC